jgi:hypothetical protein
MLSLHESVAIFNQEMGHEDAGYRARHQAIQLFWRVYAEGKRRQWWKSIVRRENNLRELGKALQGKQVKAQYAAGLRRVAIAGIRGSEGRGQDFDAAFRPNSNRTQERWVSIATARRLEGGLPPVELIQVGDDYYVRDGHHRISVAKAFGQKEIEAEVTVWEIE